MREEPLQEERQIVAERTQPATPFDQQILQKRLDELPNVSPPVIVELEAPVRDALESMAREQVDGVLVVQEDQLVGVCTTRDVVFKIAAGTVDLDQTQVGACMRPQPSCLHGSDEVAYALNQMFVSDSQLIPLVDADERPTGLISMRDIVRHLISAFPQKLLNLPPVPEQRMPAKPEGA